MTVLLAALLLGCAPKLPAIGTDRLPEALAPRDLRVPTPASATLSNGLRVEVVENHEVPIVWGTLVLSAGGAADPAGREGLAAVASSVMTLGVDGLDSIRLSAELRRLGSGVDGGASDDGASLSFNTLHRNLAETLRIVGRVVRTPTFADDELAFVRQNQLDALAQRRNDPSSVASRVLWRVVFGDAYRGRAPTEASLTAITAADCRAWHAGLDPRQSLLLVGGDVTLAEVQPLLEETLGAWSGTGAPAPAVVAPAPGPTTIHLVDMPGKAQSVVRMALPVARPTDADWFDLVLANHVVGGQFTSRLNLDLRETRGLTYGARSSVWFDRSGGWWTFNSGVHTEKTAEAIQAALGDLAAVGTTVPLTDAELGAARGALVGGYPLDFENTGFLLGQIADVWRYGLPADWIGGYLPRVRAVQRDGAVRAWAQHLHPDHLTIVVVGDAAVIRPSLQSLGLPIQERDAEGHPRTP